MTKEAIGLHLPIGLLICMCIIEAEDFKVFQRISLQAILEIMSARLGAIRSMWEEEKLKRKGLTASEVVHLIRALFEETDLRDAVIADVES